MGSHGYYADFRGHGFVRGHEYDNWRTESVRSVPDWAEVMLGRHPASTIYLRNVQEFTREEDFFAPQVMLSVAKWLRDKHDGPPFYLHVDCFDVHEPFHVPEPYRSMYKDDDYRRYNPWPPYGRVFEGKYSLSDEELAWVRAQFAGKLTMVDTWLGHVFDTLKEQGLWERTCVILTTDHGHYLGEHGWIGKPPAPLYDTLCHLLLMIWHPAGVHNGGRVGAITQTADLYATVRELLGLERPETEMFIAGASFHSCLETRQSTMSTRFTGTAASASASSQMVGPCCANTSWREGQPFGIRLTQTSSSAAPFPCATSAPSYLKRGRPDVFSPVSANQCGGFPHPREPSPLELTSSFTVPSTLSKRVTSLRRNPGTLQRARPNCVPTCSASLFPKSSLPA